MVKEREVQADEPTYQVRALQRGLAVLLAFSSKRAELSLQELHEELGLNKATLLRLLDILTHTRFVEQDAVSGRYRLGIRAFEVGNAYIANASLQRIAEPHLRELTQITGQTANLGVRDGSDVVHVVSVEPDRPIRFHTRVGMRDDLHCTGLGKVLAAYMSEGALDEYLAAAPFRPRTARTLTTASDLRREFATVREQAFAEDREETAPGLRCLAMPVRDAAGDVVGAISVSGLAGEFQGEARSDLMRSLSQASRRISEQLGYSEPIPVNNHRVSRSRPGRSARAR